MGLLGTSKLIFVFFVTVQGVYRKNFTGKNEKILQEKILQEKKQVGKNEKIKKTSG